MIALLDNTVLSNFTLVRQAEIVRQALEPDIATTQAVWNELQTGVQLGKLPKLDWSWLPVLTLTASEMSLYRQLLRRLNAGEASCLAVAFHRGYRVFTDDRDARVVAAARHIPISGTLGLLRLLVELQIVSFANADLLLAEMIATGYRSPISSLQEL